MLLTPADARRSLGFDLIDGRITIVDNLTRALSNLTQLILEVAKGDLTSRKLNKSGDRISEAERIVKSAPKRKLSSAASSTAITGMGADSKTKQGSKQQEVPRKTVAPRHKISISEPRSKDIYRELQRIRIDSFPNAAAILIRVFFELSIDDYAIRHRLDFRLHDRKSGIPLRDKQIRFQDKVLKVVEHMKANGVSRHVTAQAQSMATDPNKLFYFERLHDYIHNPHYAPLKADLPKIWDNLQAFAEALWK
jgi:hypothetical protein